MSSLNMFMDGRKHSRLPRLSVGIAFMLVLSLLLSPMAVYAEMQEPATVEAPAEALEEVQEAAAVPSLTDDSANAFLDQFFSHPEIEAMLQGAAVSIVKDGEVLALRGFGWSDVEQNVPVDPESTVFRIASVSKVFTAVAIMQLVEQGKIDLNEDIQTYLGGIQVENPFDAPVTVAHLLTHTTGFEIRDPHPSDIHTNLDEYVSIEDYVRANMPPVVREPGSSYMYDNFASLLQGYIVEQVSGEPFETYMDKHMFEPLGMHDSGFMLEGKLLDNLAVGYNSAGQPLDVYTLRPTVMPHGGMLTTAADMSKFMIAFLNGGEGENGRILSEASIQEMTKYRALIHDLMPSTAYGFEASRQLPGAGASDQIVTKAGDLSGFSSYLWFMPEENTGVFVTYNNNAPLRDQLFAAFIYQFFPQYAAPAALEAFEPLSDEQLKQFEGLYIDLRQQSLVTLVRAEEGQLILSSVFAGDIPFAQAGELLFADQNGMFIAFQRDDQGEIAYLDEPYLNPLGWARKADQPEGFRDVSEDHPYAEYIYGLQSLGLYPNDADEAFEPERLVTRAEYIQNLMMVSGLKEGSSNPSVFEDVYGHEAAPYIQFAYEMGIVSGNEHGLFEPDRPITRQEAATVIYRSYLSLFPEGQFDEVKLAGETSPWAEDAVKMMAGLGYFGPEVDVEEDGSVNFYSKQPMTRQEEAAHHYLLLTKPIF